MNPTHQTCACCGQKVRPLNAHRMCKQKVALLAILAEADDWVFVQHGYGVSVDGSMQRAPYRAEAHASRLGWFGLLEKHPTPRSGKYRITEAGRAFLRGEHQVPKTIWCKDGVVVESDTTLVGIDAVRGVDLAELGWGRYHVHSQKPASVAA